MLDLCRLTKSTNLARFNTGGNIRIHTLPNNSLTDLIESFESPNDRQPGRRGKKTKSDGIKDFGTTILGRRSKRALHRRIPLAREYPGISSPDDKRSMTELKAGSQR
jgi:hypothetical protein